MKGGDLIKVLFFDYDGVLTTDATGSLTTCRYLSEATGVSFGSLKQAFQRHNGDLSLGRTNHAAVWPEICKSVGCQIPFELLAEAFASTPPNTEMFDFARHLKASYSVGIITDNKKDRIDYLKQHQQLDAVFTPIVVSAEVGCMKDGAAIFMYALRAAGVRPEQSIFIDNARDNLLAADELGMHTVHFDDAKNDVRALIRQLHEEHGVNPNSAA
jgi:HAD superfamily hydrolase (TIGR01509 family)